MGGLAGEKSGTRGTGKVVSMGERKRPGIFAMHLFFFDHRRFSFNALPNVEVVPTVRASERLAGAALLSVPTFILISKLWKSRIRGGSAYK